ncbi:MAG: 50S ribosomal protein L9 [Chloroflexota bacterium]
MKVIFIQDVSKLAKAGETKEVADGYARNFLLPKKFALPANTQTLKIVEAEIKRQVRSQAQTEAELMELSQQLEGKEITLQARAGAKEKLYGSVTTADIATELKDKFEFVIDKRKIELTEPIRQVGSYEVAVRLAKDIVPKIKVIVVEEAA